MSTNFQPHPNSLANLRPPWQPGHPGNPGGQPKGTVHADAAYQRLGKMPIEDLRAYKPPNAVEGAIRRSLIAANDATDWQEANAALKQLILCLDGSPKQTKVVEHTVSAETKAIVIEEAYYRLFSGIDEDEALASIRAVYAAKREQDEAAMREAIHLAVMQEQEAIEMHYSAAEAEITGSK